MLLPPVPTEKFESQRIHKTVDELATTIDKELNQGIGDTDIRAGMIGEIGVSPTFTEAEHNSLRAASLAQINNPHVAMNIHMPGWLRRGDEVLDIVLGETQVNPQCRQAGMNIQCVPHRLTNTLLPEGVVFVGHG